MSPRFTPEAAAAMRSAIREAGGAEIFCVGDVVDRAVTAIEVHARGTDDSVLALLSRPRSGQVVIHNHPSGVVKPSAPDMELAGRFGEDGVGFVIVDNGVGKDLWVVEPAARRLFWTIIRERAAEGVTMIVTTHYMDEAERFDRLAFLSKGRLVALGSPAEVKRQFGSDGSLEDIFVALQEREA